jgi:MOSC domain-containing protein YiiM
MTTQRGTIVALSIGERKGMKKKNVDRALFVKESGLRHDAHAEGGIRQVSLLMDESIRSMQSRGVEVGYGDFAENVVTAGIDLGSVSLNDRITIGDGVELRVSKIGKECVTPCSIFHQVGYCIMPEEGVFCRVVEAGEVRVGDQVVLERSAQADAGARGSMGIAGKDARSHEG